MQTTLVYADKFFATARERYQIKLKREAGELWPWTKDHVFREWRFCNVHREDDATTKWFRENVRDQVYDLRAVEACVIFRAFNRIATGEIIKDLLIYGWDSKEAESRLEGISPVVTGAYILKYENGLSKLDGALSFIDEARQNLQRMYRSWGASLQGAWEDLRSIRYLGGFTAYEAVSDIRWTNVLDNANDIMTWANMGPGAARGLGWATQDNPYVFSCSAKSQSTMLPLAQELLEMSRLESNWPQEWRKWEMREVEHWLCEFDKHSRASEGQNMKRRYQQS